MPHSLIRIKKSISLHPKQAEFCRSKALFRAFLGGRGSGKSYGGAIDLLMRAKRNRTYLVAGPTAAQLHDSAFSTFKKLALEHGLWKEWHASIQTVTLCTGASVRFRSADNPDRLRGSSLSGVWLDEGGLMEREALEICQACLRENGEQGWLSCTMTPQGINHWTFELFGQQPPRPDVEVFTSCTGENPFLPPGFEATLQAQWGVTNFARQELGGEFVSMDGCEWPPEYFTDILYEQIPTDQQIICKVISCDPSTGRNAQIGDPAAVLVVYFSRTGHLWVEDSVIRVMTTTQIEDTVLQFHHAYLPNGIIVESNGFQGEIADNIVRRQPHIPMFKHDNVMDKEVRIRFALTPLLSQHRLHFKNTPNNKTLLAQMRDFPLKGRKRDGPDSLELATQLLNHFVSGKHLQSRRAPERIYVK